MGRAVGEGSRLKDRRQPPSNSVLTLYCWAPAWSSGKDFVISLFTVTGNQNDNHLCEFTSSHLLALILGDAPFYPSAEVTAAEGLHTVRTP